MLFSEDVGSFFNARKMGIALYWFCPFFGHKKLFFERETTIDVI